MEEYIVSARKYRPLSFDAVVGQSALITTLKNSVRSGKLAHAYLFCGPRGVGKTTCARIFAKTINCLTPTDDGEACNHCECCEAFNNQRSYNIFELDAASNNSVDNIKALMEQTRIPPQIGKYKVFIIDEVHMLSAAAFNAFLKTLEEPPQHVIFILATTEKQKILPTIISRCQIYDFDRMNVQEIVDHLKHVADKEGITYDEESLNFIATKADGSMRDALSIFDQAVSYCQGHITYQKVLEDLNELDTDNYFKLTDMALENKVTDMMLLLNQLLGQGFSGQNIVLGLATHMRNVLMAKDPQTLPLMEVSAAQREKFEQQAKRCPTPFLYKALKLANQCDLSYRPSSNKRLLVELTLIQIGQITQPEDEDSPAAGRSPKSLKSLFRKLMVSIQPKPAKQVAGAVTPTVSKEVAVKAEEKAKPAAPKRESAPKLKLGSLGNTFSSLRQKPDNAAKDDELDEVDKEDAQTFDEDQLRMQWMAMCNRMPQSMVGLAQRLKNMMPRIGDYPTVEVVVDNQSLLKEVENIKSRIRVTLAKNLHNANLQLNVRLAAKEELTPLLTPVEVFELMRKDNPAVEQLRQRLDLKMK